MDKFKKILKDALTSKAAGIRLFEGENITFIFEGKTAKTNELVDKAWLSNTMNFLFSSNRGSLESGSPSQTLLSVTQLGDLTINGWKKSDGWRLEIYFPQSKDMAEKSIETWNSDDQNMADPLLSGINPPDFLGVMKLTPPAPLDAAGVKDNDDILGFNPPPTTNQQKDPVSLKLPTLSTENGVTPALPPLDSSLLSPLAAIGNTINPALSQAPLNQQTKGSPQIGGAPRELSAIPAHLAPHSNQASNGDVQDDSKPAPIIIFDSNDPSKGVIRNGDFPIDAVLKQMIAKKASDLHLTLSQPIIFRIDGEIQRQSSPAITTDMMSQFLLPIMPPRNRDEFANLNDTDFAYELPGVGRFRVNMFRDNYGVGAVLRHIPSKIFTAQQLNLPKAIVDFCALQKGLVLVTGPTGSGKSTTLAAMIDKINRERSEHILTIEDPIEFVHPQLRCLVNQREIARHTTSFKRALKAALREDPDIVLIGELRDLETIAIAIETAETGHLVFGTLHTNSAISTIDRIIDQFPSNQQAQIRTMLASSLRGVVAQSLIKKKNGGRVAAHEILVSDDAIASNIREGKNHLIYNTMLTQKSQGNQLMNESLLLHAKEGTIDTLDAYLKSIDKKSFIEIAKRWGIALPFLDKDGKLLAS